MIARERLMTVAAVIDRGVQADEVGAIEIVTVHDLRATKADEIGLGLRTIKRIKTNFELVKQKKIQDHTLYQILYIVLNISTQCLSQPQQKQPSTRFRMRCYQEQILNPTCIYSLLVTKQEIKLKIFE
eukprot:TRINITY_DN3503_c0_g1_i1.p5 TRINITY_DN3503_c0_g1~~TRINITY_DN3503_c0_g1_i1.p5  ORF type:complete len:147 (-),score=1.87 TRINITY_DN3503_c0_g1_i1:2066-2449(-)